MKDAPSYLRTAPKNTTNNMVPPEGPRVVPVVFSFSNPGDLRSVNLLEMAQQHKISNIQGAWINTYGRPGVIIRTNVIGQQINVPADSQGFVQLLVEGTPIFEIEGDASGEVIIHFLNFPVVHFLDVPGSGGGGIQSVIGGTGISVDNTDPLNPIINATGGGGGPPLYALPIISSGTSDVYDISAIIVDDKIPLIFSAPPGAADLTIEATSAQLAAFAGRTIRITNGHASTTTVYWDIDGGGPSAGVSIPSTNNLELIVYGAPYNTLFALNNW